MCAWGDFLTKDEALKKFYDKNSLNLERVCNINSADFDIRLSKLSDQIDKWLEQIAELDQNYFLECLSEYTYLTKAQCEMRFVKIVIYWYKIFVNIILAYLRCFLLLQNRLRVVNRGAIMFEPICRDEIIMK